MDVFVIANKMPKQRYQHCQMMVFVRSACVQQLIQDLYSMVVFGFIMDSAQRNRVADFLLMMHDIFDFEGLHDSMSPMVVC
ncbi:hypothetical protein MTYM_00283 [Methylococcales bacterium]|nr:hypothetical protein MTYM_00283 [Methylococcales bacterium]